MSNDHPLYPKPEDTYDRISLYPPKECSSCRKMRFDVELRTISRTETQAMWIAPGTTFNVETEEKKLCARCYSDAMHPSIWG